MWSCFNVTDITLIKIDKHAIIDTFCLTWTSLHISVFTLDVILLWELHSHKTMWYCYEKSILTKPCDIAIRIENSILAKPWDMCYEKSILAKPWDIAMRNPFSQKHVILQWEIHSCKTIRYCYEKSILAKPCDIAMRNPFSQNHVILPWEIHSRKTKSMIVLYMRMWCMYKSLVRKLRHIINFFIIKMSLYQSSVSCCIFDIQWNLSKLNQG